MNITMGPHRSMAVTRQWHTARASDFSGPTGHCCWTETTLRLRRGLWFGWEGGGGGLVRDDGRGGGAGGCGGSRRGGGRGGGGTAPNETETDYMLSVPSPVPLDTHYV